MRATVQLERIQLAGHLVDETQRIAAVRTDCNPARRCAQIGADTADGISNFMYAQYFHEPLSAKLLNGACTSGRAFL